MISFLNARKRLDPRLGDVQIWWWQLLGLQIAARPRIENYHLDLYLNPGSQLKKRYAGYHNRMDSTLFCYRRPEHDIQRFETSFCTDCHMQVQV